MPDKCRKKKKQKKNFSCGQIHLGRYLFFDFALRSFRGIFFFLKFNSTFPAKFAPNQ